MDFSIGSRHYHVSLLVLLGVAIGLVWWFARGTTIPVALETWWASGHAEAQAAGKLHTALADSARHIATLQHQKSQLDRDTAQLRRTAHMEQGQIENLVRSVDSLHRAPLTAAVRRFGEACGELAQNCEHRVLLLTDALETANARATMAITGKAHADSIIAAGLQATQCKFLLWSCMSRTHMLEFGLMTGIVATLVVRH